jgi:hypothetical protein
MTRRLHPPVAPLLAGQMSPDYIRSVPTIDLPDDELAAVTAAIRGLIEGDRYPRAPRLDTLRSALAKLDPKTAPKLTPERQPVPKAPQSRSVLNRGTRPAE